MISFIEVAGSVLLFALVFGMSATVDIRALFAQLKNKKAIITGCFLQFIILPLLGFIVVKALAMNETMGITLLVVTSSPGGSYSNWWCSMFNADLALSVTMTAISTIISVVMLPINLLIYSKLTFNGDVLAVIDWTSLFVALSVVIGAIVLGLFCSAKIHSFKFNVFANRLGNIAGIALVIFSATMSNTGGGDARIWNRDWKFYVGVSLPCVGGLLVSNILTTALKLKKPERVTVAIECCYQNVGIATSVALTMFDGNNLAEAMGVPLYYGILEAVILGVYCLICWKCNWTKAPSNAPICRVITTSYEVFAIEKKDLESVEVTLCTSDENDETLAENGDTIFSYFQMSDVNDLLGLHGKKEPSGMIEEEELYQRSIAHFQG
jgi:predicted Na+-dependent transporter